MSHHPSDQNKVTEDRKQSNLRSVDAAEVIRRLDKLWVDEPAAVAGPFSSAVGTSVGRYVLERIIGRGAFGIVYKAHDPDLNRAVAIKIPRPDVLLDGDRLARFETEVQACARLDHPGIVPLYEADLSRAVPYMASAYCPGPNLQQWMDEAAKPCAIDAAVAFIEKVARAVQYAHDHGIVHRDLKPGNILLVPNDFESSSLSTLDDFQPRLTDFGLAQMTHGLHQSQSSLIIGTPLYMSPEQAESRNDDVGPVSDVFGLGAILYHLLTGVAPFAAHNYAGVLLRLREGSPVSVLQLRPEVHADLDTVCMKCLQRNPADRYSSAAALADDLQRCLKRQPIQGRRMSLLHRVRRWFEQSERIHEATLLISVLASMRLIFGPGGMLMIAAAPDVNVSHEEVIEALLAQGLVPLPADLWTVWAVRRVRSKKSSQWVYWIALVFSVCMCLSTMLIAIGVIPPIQWYRRSIGARVLVFSLISLTYFIQALAWCVADWRRMQNTPDPLLRRSLKLLLISIPVLTALAVPGYRETFVLSEAPALAGPEESIQLDGLNDVLTINNLAFEEGRAFTLEAWIRPDKQHRGAVASHGPVALTVVAAGDGNRFRVHVSTSEGEVYLLDAKELFALDRWTHIAMTYDGSEMRMYVNGRYQVCSVSVYEMAADHVSLDRQLPSPFVVQDLWPGSRFLVGNLKQSDTQARFQYSGRIGEVRLSRSVFYHEEFAPESTLRVVPETILLLHLRDGLNQIKDATGRHVADVYR
jgi:serine/threonine protein kinase